MSGANSRKFRDRLWRFLPHVLTLVLISIVACVVASLVSLWYEGSLKLESMVQVEEARASDESPPAYPDVFIEVNIPATEMTVYMNGEELFRRRVAIGSPRYPTPEQEESIHVIEWNPWWFPPDAYWARNDKPTPPGPRNPLGSVKLRLGKYGEIMLHGTNKSWSVGRPSSHGCMRMLNDDAASFAWFLQSNFSDENDPMLFNMYMEKRRRTFRVELDYPVPVRLVYNPVVVRDNKLKFYPDHYRKFWENRKAAMLKEMVSKGISIDVLDDDKIERLSKNWPSGEDEIPISDLLIDPPPRDLLSAPECS